MARDLGGRAVWICTATSDGDRDAAAAGAVAPAAEQLGYGLEMLELERETYTTYYDDISNRMLWFALHELSGRVGASEKLEADAGGWAAAYARVNQVFAEAVCRSAAPEARVLVQDYHLALVPQLVKAARPDVRILHFTHSAFSGPSGLRVLPESIRKEFVAGMAASDIVGFHVPSWCGGFLDAARSIGEVDPTRGTVRRDGRTAWVRSYPIQIDCAGLRRQVTRPEAQRWVSTFTPQGRYTLIGRTDRLEPSKNISLGFEAFGKLLDGRPDLEGKVRFVACCYPSRATMEEYRSYREEVLASVATVEERHPGAIELYLDDDFDRSLGLLASADIVLVNPWMDGMNLVSKEAVCLNDRDAVLVLSRRAGSFAELGTEAVAVDDPGSVDQTVSALEQALAVKPLEREAKSRRLKELVASRTPAGWIQAQLDDLDGLARQRPPRGWLLSHGG